MGSGILDGKLSVAGGRNQGIAGGTTYDDFVRFNAGPGKWETPSSLPTRRAGDGLAVADRRIWAIGGEIGLIVLASVDIYDPETEK